MVQNLDSTFLKKYELVSHSNITGLNNTVLSPWNVAITGNYKLLADIIEPQIKLENFGFNKLHLDVLRLDKLTEKYATISITKKSVTA